MNNQSWLSKSAAARRLEARVDVVDQLIAEGLVGVRQLPGGRLRVASDDIDRLAATFTRPAKANGAPRTNEPNLSR